MEKSPHPLRLGALPLAGCLMTLILLVALSVIGGPLEASHAASLYGQRGYAPALAPAATIDHGDPAISDAHLSFMDRGRYAYQDMACEDGCGAGAVNVVHGNLVYGRQDLSIHGRGLPLEVRFTYNSGSFFEGRYGYGWQLNLNLRYVTNSVNESVIVVREDDRTDIFVRRWDGSFRATYGVRNTLEACGSDCYLLVDRDGVQYWFDSPDHHYVTRMEDLNGNTLTFAYDSDRQLTSVTDASLRQITLNYTDGMLAEVIDPMGRIFTYDYDANGDLIQVTDPLGFVTTYEYTPDCHDLVTATDARGHARTIAYNADYQVESITTCGGLTTLTYGPAAGQTTVTDGNGHATIYWHNEKRQVVLIEDPLAGTTSRTWDEAYRLLSTSDPLDQTTTYTYDLRANVLSKVDAQGMAASNTWHTDFNKMTSTTDRNGYMTTYDYDPNGYLLTLVDPLGQATLFNYYGDGLMESRTDPRGYMTHYEYDANGYLSHWLIEDPPMTPGSGRRPVSPAYYESTYSYDPVGNRISETDANGYAIIYEYDDMNHLTDITDPLGNEIDYSYDPVGNRISETDANGYTTNYEYDPLNRLVQIEDALLYTTNYSYDPVGNRISETDANGNVTNYSYDPLNRLVSRTDALGCEISYSYDPVGNRISETDANGNITNYSYDDLNRLVNKADALAYETNYSYDPVGNRISGTNPNGYSTTYSYDPLNRLCTVEDAMGNTTNYSYDPVGNRISETDANGHATSFTYDGLNNMTSLTDALGLVTNYSYDPVGNRISEVDANGYTIGYSYDPLNRLAQSTDELGYETNYSYDPVGNRISETDALLRTWEYEYDELNRCVRGRSPLGNETAYEYDPVGNRITRTDPNGTLTHYSYDAVNRPLQVAYDGGDQVDYTYDCVGNTLTTVHIGGLGDVIESEYDELSRLRVETIHYGLFSKQVSYTYDGLGNIVTLTDPDAQTLMFLYDESGRWVHVVDRSGLVTDIVYDPAARRTETYLPNGTWMQYDYDQNDRVTAITTYDPADNPLTSYTYDYDDVGRITDVARDGAPEAHWDYDGAGRLTDAFYVTGQDFDYGYDAVGNRSDRTETATIPNVTFTYDYNDEDRVLTQQQTDPPGPPPIVYAHDNNANVNQTQGSMVVGYHYDLENDLVRLDDAGVPVIGTDIFYAPDGRLLARDEQGLRTYYYPTLLGTVVEMDVSGQTTMRLNPGISMYLEEPPPEESPSQIDWPVYIHWDGRGSTTFFTDASAAEVASFGFDYFGQVLYASGDTFAVEPGLYATDMKIDWDPMLGAELIGGDYAPDINQSYGGVMFDPDELFDQEHYWRHDWVVEPPFGGGDPFVPADEIQEGVQQGAGQGVVPDEPEPDCSSPCSGYACLPASWGSRDGKCSSKANQDFIGQMRTAVRAAARNWADKDCENKDGPGCICAPTVAGGWGKSSTQNPWTEVEDSSSYDSKTDTCTIKIEYDYDGKCKKGSR